MWYDKVFAVALAVSVSVHAAILLGTYHFRLTGLNKGDRKMEVRYIELPKEAKLKVPVEREQVKKDPLVELSEKLGTHKLKLPPLAGNSELSVGGEKGLATTSMSEEGLIAKPSFTRPDIAPVKRRITLSQMDVSKNSSPAYVNFSTMCREKVRRAAYQNYTQLEEGEVYLSFVVSSDGVLRDVRLFEDRTTGSPYLREIALKSIRDASPFLKFPKELDYPQLTFNVVISFETE